jgi:hypothetical protein
LDQRKTGVDHGRKLSGEEHDVFDGDLWGKQGYAGEKILWSVLNGVIADPKSLQKSLHLSGVLGFHLTFAFLALGVEATPSENRHMTSIWP